MSDLSVENISDALAEHRLDVIVSGSIGAVESVRFIRALRRLGAEVTPWLTAGGAQFITATALEWAANAAARQNFSGTASHIGTGAACVIAPASANFIGKIARGETDSPASALVASYLGQKKPVIIVPNMHTSLYHSPVVKEHVEKLKSIGVVLPAREEEAKQKFPEPNVLADRVAHQLRAHATPVLLNMGSTRGYIDEVRYVSNYSSGALGALVAEELYRQGFQTTVVCGAAQREPQSYGVMQRALTNAQMEEHLQGYADAPEKFFAVVYLASVLDFIPAHQIRGKISSSEELKVEFVKAKKLLNIVEPQKGGVKIAFKLGVNIAEGEVVKMAENYLLKNNLHLLLYNDLNDVSSQKHKARLFFRDRSFLQDATNILNSKAEIAAFLTKFIDRQREAAK